jgi:hypothetical protein
LARLTGYPSAAAGAVAAADRVFPELSKLICNEKGSQQTAAFSLLSFLGLVMCGWFVVNRRGLLLSRSLALD